MGNLYASPPGEVTVEMKLLFEFKGLVPGVGLTAPFSF